MVITTCVNSSDVVLENRLSAEYFDPKYVFTPNNNFEWRRIGRILKKCQYGISISMNEDGIGFPIFRMNEIDNCFTTKAKKYANISFREFENFRLQENDILFNRTNSLEFVGRTGIVKDQNDSVFASYLIRIVPNDELVLPEFLTIYLNTEFGIGQVKRRAMPSINQANVSASELKHVLIPLIPIETQKDIANLVNLAYQRKRESKELYIQAQQLLESELWLDKLEFEKPVGYEASFSNVANNNRCDADYYQPKYKQLDNIAAKFDVCLVREFSEKLETGQYATNYTETGHPYIRGVDIESNGYLETDSLIKTSKLPAKANNSVKKDDILVTRVGSIGVCGLIEANLAGGLFSDNLIRIRIRDNFKTRISAHCLNLLFNTTYGQMQMVRFSRGSVQQRLNQTQLGQLPIPIIPFNKQMEIESLLISHRKSKHESKQLLEQAKRRVEQLIEEAVTK